VSGDDNGPVLKRLAVVAAWVIATMATATITLAAVGAAGREVSVRPAVPISSTELAARFAASSTTQPGSTTSLGVTSTTPTTLAETTTSTSTSTTHPATTTTAPPSTTTAGSSGQTSTYEQPGVGRVTIKVSGDQVTYVTSVILGSGYHVEVGDAGPEKVVVKFEKDGGDYTFVARVGSGGLEAGFSAGESDD
jgi:hypothetical protein